MKGYAPTSSHDDNKVEHKHVELAMQKVGMQYTTFMGEFSAKVGRKQEEESRNMASTQGIAKVEMLVAFAESS